MKERGRDGFFYLFQQKKMEQDFVEKSQLQEIDKLKPSIATYSKR